MVAVVRKLPAGDGSLAGSVGEARANRQTGMSPTPPCGEGSSGSEDGATCRRRRAGVAILGPALEAANERAVDAKLDARRETEQAAVEHFVP